MLLTDWLQGVHRQLRFARGSRLRQRRGAPASRVAAQVALLEDRSLLSSTMVGPETLVNGTVAGNQRFSPRGDSSFAVDSQGTMVAAWTTQGATIDDTNIVARRIDAGGTPVGSDFTVNTSTVGTRTNATVAFAADGKFVVAWDWNTVSSIGLEVYARVYSANGTPLTGEFRVNSTSGSTQVRPSVDWISADSFVIGWSGEGKGDADGVVARIFKSNGAAVTDELRVNEYVTGTQQNAAVVATPGGGFQVAWNGVDAGDSSAILSRRFDAAGKPLGATFRVSTATDSTETLPAIATDGTSQVVIAWQSTGHSLDTSGSGVIARRFALDGTPLGPEFRLSQTTNGNQLDPSLAFLADGRLAAVWQGAGADETAGVFVREFNPDGTAADNERLVNKTTAGTQADPSVREQGTGYVVLWDGNFVAPAGGTSDSTGIVLQRFTTPTTPTTPAAGFAVDFQVTNDWGSGFGASVTIKNNTASALNGWTLEFDFPYNITDIWNAQIVSHVGNHYVLKDKGYNAAIAAGGTVSFGFNGAPGNVTSKPANYVLNGVPLGSTGSATPALSVTDISLSEGNSGTKQLTFTVTLSQSSTKTVTVAYATSNATATAGTDYTAASGTLSFSPGQTSKTVAVTISGDTTVELDETFKLTLSNPVNATLSRSEATGTIANDDVPPPVVPDISIDDVQVVEGNAQPVAAGYFHTQGSQIVDANNRPVRLAGVNWFGFETANYAPHGLWTRGYKDMMNQMKQEEFNVIRLPFSNQLFDSGSVPNGIDFGKNPDLQGLTGLQIMDKIVSYAGQIGLRIILDHHRSDAGNGADGSGLWYTAAYSESRWISDWTMLAQRYGNNPTVIAADLHNEPHGPANWGAGGANDWRLAAERAGNAILAVNSNWMILVEGVENGKSGSYWWGGNLSNAGDYPVRLNVAGRLVYSPHDYPASVYNQKWFSDPNYPNNLPAVWDAAWGYLFRQGTAPILLGEFGSKLATTSDQQWFDKMIQYISGDLNGDGTSDLSAGQLGISWTYWSWNPNSGDTGGILNDDWTTVNQTKVNKLKPVEFALDAPGNSAMFTISLSQATSNSVSVSFATANGTAAAGSDYTSTTGTVTFNPGETKKTIWIPITGDTTKEANETFAVKLSNAVNGTIIDGSGLGTITNDDA